MNPASPHFRSDLAGVWRRLPSRFDDRAGQGVAAAQDACAWRVQAGGWFAQWAQSSAVQAVRAQALPQLPPADLALLASQQAQWGVMLVEPHPEGEVARWTPLVDFQPPGIQPAEGWLLFDQPDRCIEIDIHSDRTQVWVREPGTAWQADEVWCLQALDAQGQAEDRFLWGAADWRVHVRPRGLRWPSGLQAGMTMHDLLLHQPDQVLNWLDHELSLGRCIGAQCEILCSSLPERRGSRVPTSVSWANDRQRALVRWGSEERWWQRLETMAP